jgi:outer membrane PBP1 activator LpoA protein
MKSVGHCAHAFLALAVFFACPALCEASGGPASGMPAPREDPPVIVLLVPLASPDFAPAAQAVVAGCKAALAQAGNPLSIQVAQTDATPDAIISAYQAAAARGATAIVGPLTRDGVTALARGTTTGPLTLALNSPEDDAEVRADFYTFGLSIENEARVVARQAFADGLRNAAVVLARSALERRVGRAFANEWFALGGQVSDVVEFSQDEDFVTLREYFARSRADLVFLSADAAQARLARPYLNIQIPIYAVSLVHGGHDDALSIWT